MNAPDCWPLLGHFAFVPASKKRRSRRAICGFYFDQLFSSRRIEGKNIVSGPVSVLGRHPPDPSSKVFPPPIRESPAFNIDHKSLAGFSKGAVQMIAFHRIEFSDKAP